MSTTLRLHRGGLAPIDETRLRVLPGIGGPLAPVVIVGLSVAGSPLMKLEVPLAHIHEAASMVRVYLARRDREGRG